MAQTSPSSHQRDSSHQKSSIMPSIFGNQNGSSSKKGTSFDVEKVLSQLSLVEKINLTTGDGWWQTVAVPRLNVPSVRMSDGPNGIRGTRFFRGTPSSCFPCATALAASFDVETVEKVGKAIGEESVAKGVHIWLGPTMNTQRSPLGGRGFESFSEDPVLQGLIGSSIIKGAQEAGVSATQKHYVANDAELNRFKSSSNLSEKALREIYLKPFQIVCSHPSPQAVPWATMTAYNRVNDLHVSESPRLLDDILRKEWSWKGLIMSDWTGTYSTVEALRAGLDIEMPGPAVVRGSALGRALAAGKLHMDELNAPVRNVLEAVKRAQVNGRKFDAPEESVDTPELRSVLLQAAASSTVLLKNDLSILPLSGLKKANDLKKKYSVAVIGPNTNPGSISGGGSASLLPTYCVSAKEAILAEAKKAGVDASQVGWSQGVYAHRFMPPLAQYLKDSQGKVNHANLSFYDNLNFAGEPVWSESVDVRLGMMFFIDGLPDTIPDHCSCRLEANITPSRAGPWEFGIYSAGRAKLFVNGEMVVDNWTDGLVVPGDGFFGLGSAERRGVYKFSEQETQSATGTKLMIEFQNDPSIQFAGPFLGGKGGIGFGGVPQIGEKELREEAVEMAKNSEDVILVVGLNGEWESEGYDRSHMKLPPGSDALIEAVLSANPRTVVVTQSGTPVEMPWVEKCSTLVQSWYAGNEQGNAIASVLFGRHAPHGRLPLTYPKALQDVPNFLSFPETRNNGLYGTLDYNEGSDVGYRFYNKTQKPVLFEFGYGLSYTTFKWDAVKLTKTEEKRFDDKIQLMAQSKSDKDIVWTVSTRITNEGKVPSKEVVQLYSSRKEDTVASAELRAFALTKELNPGESQDISLQVRLTDLSIWDETHRIDGYQYPGCWHAQEGTYTLSVGRSCQKIESSVEVKLEASQELRWKGIVTRIV